MATANRVGATTFTTASDREVVMTRAARAARLHRVVGRRLARNANTLILSEEGGKTTLTCTVLYPSKEARDAALETGMKEGASTSFDRLAEYLRTMA